MAQLNISGALFRMQLAASSLALGHQADGQLLAVIKTPSLIMVCNCI